ncbi:16S rRNA (cytosine(1402)-N(4))-methyltransferase RsmH [uncultured Peptoniphilus sp.]|uniref:16S rRNA (cytosine(1402)-N(4))-methyltransferase RsmH n=1 Tax=uncultured Peptoniphilus sp. TaxID=254354 RepID=UPI0025846046|nr:16S rRNA (cytosine(1402)-N(4))-methyltransferase RsmH [uncultured Peptoniphilus sp.]MBS5946274.1 16S rRNA (cytosine(1402)-N(4))-methyltransferase RsmH [Peptoniphilus harei]MDU6782854.1 16S rRNA (cytosine(1402)-N(4))-methyltransferase RsmH [Peptoniphilus harei]
MDFSHKSVLLKETIEGLNVRKGKIYLDGTLGGAGHSYEILKKLDGTGLLIGIDQDEEALKAAREKLSDFKNVEFFNLNYIDFEKALDELGIEKIDGVLLDIGVSSYQFDNPERGFSYRFDAPLDMRMDKNLKISAKEIVNTYSESEITQIIKDFGEEKWASRISKFIVEERKNKSIDTTFDLVEIIKNAIPASARRNGPHPAKRTFQALRIEVNKELDVLKNSIDKFVKRLNPCGRIAIITFHSLEDRIVKNSFKYLEKDCICPPTSPICTCDKKREIKIITRKPITASEDELKENNRSHSAKLRIAEKLEV